MTANPGRRSSRRASYERLSPAQRDAYYRALEAVNLMRSGGLSLSTAALAAGTSPATVRRHAGAALSRQGGRYRVAVSDRLYRRMAVPTADGPVEVDVRSSRQASRLGAYYAARNAYLHTGDASHLARFKNTRIGGHLLPTDPALVERLVRRGEISIEDIYPHR